MRITVFGGSAPKPGEAAYQEAYQLGGLIGRDRHTILTGGYIGTMEAASRGCAEAGGHVIGVTCEEIEAWRPVKPNQWVQEEIRRESLKERLFDLIEKCDAAIALPGGAGTLTEISLMWNQMQIQALPVRPLTLVGSGWQLAFEQIYAELDSYFAPAHRDLLEFAPDVNQAYQIVTRG
ncbi:MAG: LOG family protein [Chloroflexota bacterium]